MAWELKLGKHIILDTAREQIELGENKTTPEFDLGRLLLSSIYSCGESLSSVSLVNKEKEFIWNKVVKIETLPEEQVYDIEVEGTHNFIGNDIVAHNTYLTGGLGAGVAETTNGNITGTGRLSITGTAATSTFSTGGLAVGTNQFVVQQNSGNVGIGIAAPTELLHLSSSNGINLQVGSQAILGHFKSSGSTLLGYNVKVTTGTNNQMERLTGDATIDDYAIVLGGSGGTAGIQFHTKAASSDAAGICFSVVRG